MQLDSRSVFCHTGNMAPTRCTCGFDFGDFDALPFVGTTPIPPGRDPARQPGYVLVLRRCPVCGTTLGAEKPWEYRNEHEQQEEA